MSRIVTKFNLYTGEYKQVSEDWEVKYNVQSGRYEFTPPENTYPSFTVTVNQYNLQGAIGAKYNPSTGSLEAANDDWELVLNPMTGKREYVRRGSK